VPEQPAVDFAALLKRLRTDAGMTQEGLADAAGLSPRSISDLERGINKKARRDTARLLADALQLAGAVRAGFEAAARGQPPPGSGMPGAEGARARSVAATTPVLPHDIRSFTGRQPDLARLMAAVTGTGDVVGIYAIDGMAGVGKSAFAVHAAHVLASRFPDGQIFLQLHAHTLGHRPVEPADALASLLLTTGVPARQIPAELAARERLWRSHLADKQVLLLLDDAASHEQVKPLLPGTPGSLVLVTSRRHLSALDDATSICLQTLPPDEAAALLIRLADRADLDPADPAVAEINRLCGYLPLAIGMLARQLHHHPAWSVVGLASELAASRDRLELMHAENLSVAAAFDLSYQDLSDVHQQLFRRLGLHPGTDIDSYAAAALDGSSLSAARRGLSELFDQHLVTEPSGGRYRLHDLIREHARALADTDDPADRETALGRLTEYYVTAAGIVGRHFKRGELDADDLPGDVPRLATRSDAAAWLEAERANMHAVVDYAAVRQWPGPGIAIADAMSGFLRTHGHWTQMRVLHSTALETARQAGYQRGEADVLISLGVVQRLTGDYAESAATLARALQLCSEVGDQLGQAQAMIGLGVVQRLTVSYPVAASTLTEAMQLYHTVGDQLGQADAMNELGCVQRLAGDYPAALAGHQRALARYRELRDRLGQADSLRYIGRVHQETGDYSAVMPHYARALDLYRGLGDRIGQAHALNYLGTAQRVTAGYPAAEATLTEALELYRALGHRLGQAEVLNNLGELYSAAAPARARACHEQALDIAREIKVLLEQARALEGLGTMAVPGTLDGAGGTRLRRARELYQQIGSPHAARLEHTLGG
jgi:tetratricopeptide (TPR) repeat protein/DNA-binding XRE family transcriptional regulator